MKRLREIENFPGYRVGDDGSFIKIDGTVLKPVAVRMKSNGGSGGQRAYVTLRRNGKRYDLRVATLVLTAFIGPRPSGMLACHKDDDRANNEIENLYWGTHKSNLDDARRNGRIVVGSRHHSSRLTESDIPVIREKAESGATIHELSRKYHVDRKTIRDIVTRKTWRHV